MFKTSFMEDKDMLILYCQYHDCRWPGDDQSQGISSHGIDLVVSEYITSGTKSVM